MANKRVSAIIIDSEKILLVHRLKPNKEYFVLPGGSVVNVLVFREGDVYRITQEGNRLNLHAEPSRASRGLVRMETGDKVTILDGPVQAENFVWWKFSLERNGQVLEQGWAVENPLWYERIW